MNPILVRLKARVRRRLKYALGAAVLISAFAVVRDWLGLPTAFRPVNQGHPFSDIWWYFPVFGAVGFVVALLLPKGFDKDVGL